MKKVLIDGSNLIVNIVEIADGAAYTPPSGLRMLNVDAATAHIGGTWDEDTQTFAEPPKSSRPLIADLHDKLAYGEATQDEIAQMLRIQLGLTDGPPLVREVPSE